MRREVFRMATLVARVTAATKVGIVVSMAGMTAVVAAEVFARYVLNASISFSEELSRLLFVWAGFLSASLALREGLHIGMDLVKKRFGGRARRAITAINNGLTLILLVTVVAAGGSILPDQWQQRTTTLGISVFWFYLAIPTGCSLMILQLLGRALAPDPSPGAAGETGGER
jgi:TRAP-type C4-dicarboxylate transport system permease small subunit